MTSDTRLGLWGTGVGDKTSLTLAPVKPALVSTGRHYKAGWYDDDWLTGPESIRNQSIFENRSRLWLMPVGWPELISVQHAG